MNLSSVNNTNALTAYIDNLNEKAKAGDLRNHPFVPPKGTVLTVACDSDNHARIGVANGKGGITPHQLPAGVFFTCKSIESKRAFKPWRLTLFLQRLVGLEK